MRKRHNMLVRQEKLKKSIKVLGPTDPGVLTGYVKRDEQDAGIEGGIGG